MVKAFVRGVSCSSSLAPRNRASSASSAPGVDHRLSGAAATARSTISTKASGRSGRASRRRERSPRCVRLLDGSSGRAFDRVRLCDQVVQQDAQCVDVGGLRPRPSAEHLRRQIQRCTREIAEARPQHRLIGFQVLPAPEIHEHGSAALLAHHIVGFDVAVHQSRAVHSRQRAAQIQTDECRLARAKWPLRPRAAPRASAPSRIPSRCRHGFRRSLRRGPSRRWHVGHEPAAAPP